MRRAKPLFILSLSSLGCGLALTAGSARHLPVTLVIGAATVILGGIGAAAVLLLLQRSCRQFIEQIRSRQGLPQPGRCEVPDTGFIFLNRAYAEAMEAAAPGFRGALCGGNTGAVR